MSSQFNHIDFRIVFSGAPWIYIILFSLSAAAFGLWLYTLYMARPSRVMPAANRGAIKNALEQGDVEMALQLCRTQLSLFSQMIETAIHTSKGGHQVMLDAMAAQGKELTSRYWHRIHLINDIALIAPMIGLLGTVLGMFYAFYDVSRSPNSLMTLFDGLGVSVGTTLAGLIVSLLAMGLHISLRTRLASLFGQVDAQTILCSTLLKGNHEPHPR